MSGENGELTQPVYWEGEQWAATGYGVEGLGRKGYYNIPIRDLGRLDGDDLSMWPDHIARKPSFNSDEFNRAFYEAVRAHNIALPAKAMVALEQRIKP